MVGGLIAYKVHTDNIHPLEAAAKTVLEVRTSALNEDHALVPEGTGSAIIVDSRGYLLTCLHVVDTAVAISVEWNGTHAAATVVAKDESLDLALLFVGRQLPPPTTWGSSKVLRLGDTAYAIGFPFDVSRLLRRGVVALVNIDFDGSPFIVTDAQINPGDSGGGVFNEAGELIGISARIQTAQGLRANIGIAYAIPSDVAHWFVTNALPQKSE